MKDFFKVKSTDELIEETRRNRALLESIEVKNKIVTESKSVKVALKKAKREAFDNSLLGGGLKHLKGFLDKKAQANKKKAGKKNKDDAAGERWTPGILKD